MLSRALRKVMLQPYSTCTKSTDKQSTDKQSTDKQRRSFLLTAHANGNIRRPFYRAAGFLALLASQFSEHSRFWSQKSTLNYLLIGVTPCLMEFSH